MRKIVLHACLLPLVLICCVHAVKPDRTDPELAQLLMQSSGLNKQLEQMPRIMQIVLARGRVQDPELKVLPQAEFEEVVLAMGTAFDAAFLKESVQKRLLSGLPRDAMQSALIWLESPLGRKITSIEEAASSPEAFADRREALDRTKGAADRVLRLRRLDNAIKGTESAINAYLVTQVAVVTALTAQLPEKDRPSVNEILNLLRKMEPDWRQSAERDMLRYFLDTYRTLSDTELDRYIGFAESAEGQKYHAALMEAVMDAMLQASGRIGSQMGQKTAEIRPHEQ